MPPLLPTLVTEPPEGEEWEHEIKYDGYRTLIVLDHGKARAFTRNGHQWKDRYAPVVGAALRLRCKSASIDGEMIVPDEHGRSDFAGLRSEGEPHRLVFMAFDLIGLNGEDLRTEPLRVRRQKLHRLVGNQDPSTPIQLSESQQFFGRDLLAAACAMGLEGIVSKRLDSRYRSGRQRSWLKIKCYDEGEYLVIGAEHEPGKPASALLAREGSADLEYAGSAFVTLAGEERDRFWTSVEQHRPADPAVGIQKREGARWVEPVMRVRV